MRRSAGWHFPNLDGSNEFSRVVADESCQEGKHKQTLQAFLQASIFVFLQSKQHSQHQTVRNTTHTTIACLSSTRWFLIFFLLLLSIIFKMDGQGTPTTSSRAAEEQQHSVDADANADVECNICYNPAERNRRCQHCRHLFCLTCIQQWLNTATTPTCPMVRPSPNTIQTLVCLSCADVPHNLAHLLSSLTHMEFFVVLVAVL